MRKTVLSSILDIPACVVLEQSLFDILEESESLLANEQFVCHTQHNNTVVVDIVELVVISLCGLHRVLSHTLHQLDGIALKIALI